MDMSNFRPESHVAQQSRRDKLRIQPCSNSVHQLEDYTHNSGQSSANPDLIQVRTVRNANLLYDPTLGSTEIISFSTNQDVLSAHRNAILHQELGAAAQSNNRLLMGGEDLFTNLPHPVSSQFNVSSRSSGDFQGCGNWKSLDSQPNSGWVVNYASGSAARESNQNAMLVGEVLSNDDVKASNISSSRKYLKPNNYNEYHQYVQSSLTNPSSEISSQDRQKHYGEMHYATSLYQNTVHDVVTLASSIGTQGLEVASLVQQNPRETAHGTWMDSGNELVLLPNYANQSSEVRYDGAGTWMNRPEESCHQWSTESGFIERKRGLDSRTAANDATTQGLSLSLSSNPPSKMYVAQLGDGYESQDPHSRTDIFKEPQDSKAPKSGHPCSILKPSIISKGCGKSLQELVGSSDFNIHRSGGPLGPFTGYATILKSSRFLKPAQELLDEFCTIAGSKFANSSDASERVSGDQISASVSASADADVVDAADKEVGAKRNSSSAVSSSTFYGSNQISCDGGVGSSSSESYRPEYQQKKAKLLHLQEEVFRRYKLYHQQMQMVVSSFESVAGLSAATPYVSLALKTISKNFRCLKNIILNQLKLVTKALGEDLLSSPGGTSTGRVGDTNTTTMRLKYADHCFQRHKSSGGNVGFLEPQQHVWRPQRGLPERSVSILRAWLFEHFLHPYPTDTDKHMLATQTGLSRNQVSNWFINARVRVWKPMVEEIHMLETKGMAETNQNSSKSDGKSTSSEGTGRSSGDQPMNKVGISAMSDEQLDYSGIGSSVGTEDGLISTEQWNPDKRSRVECQVKTNMDRSFMSFMPYQRGGLEVGGLGAVSLTLGLRHGVESSQQQQQQTDQLRQQLGGQMIHDFVG